MSENNTLQLQREASLAITKAGPPSKPSNQFFGVGPITDMTADEVERRLLRFEFEIWLEESYPKLNDQGRPHGPITRGEMERGMHRGYPADKVVHDMMREIHRYFEFPKQNLMAVGLGGGHNGFSVCTMHLMNANMRDQRIYVDTPKPESGPADKAGFFRQSWASQIIELQRFADCGDESRIHFAKAEGHIPSVEALCNKGIKLFVGVGHETTGATSYSEEDVSNLLAWLDTNPDEHHALIDATSMLGAMPWRDDIVQQMISKCCFFMPFQKAIGGVAGYFAASFTPAAMALIEKNMQDLAWAIPRHLKIAVPDNAKRPFSSPKTTSLGPIYDPQQDKMLGGIVNTFSSIAFAETTFGLLRMERRVGSVNKLNQNSIRNRDFISAWVDAHPLFELGVEDASRRGVAVTLLKVVDPDISDSDVHTKIIGKAKQLLSYEGLTHVDGTFEKGLDVARYVNAFPGTPGDFRAWIGGIRPQADVEALLDNFEYAYHRAKVVVLEELLAEQGIKIKAAAKTNEQRRCDDPKRAYKVLIADPVGLKFDASGAQDVSEVKSYIEAQGAYFHLGDPSEAGELDLGKIHFFYQPNLSREEEILPITDRGQYDAVIAAATFLPRKSVFNEGGVRIGAGTGNMGSESWGTGDGEGGIAPLMNTPSFNSRATAQMVFKALLHVAPDLPLEEVHYRVTAGDFDTGKNLREFPTEKIEGKRIAVLGYGNIGREVCKLAKAFGMQVVVYARERHRIWIESEGFIYADSPEAAAQGADFLSPHLGLGVQDPTTGKFTNANAINLSVLNALKDASVVINFDRGELIDINALDEALSSGKVRFISVDADMFLDATNEVTGPMAPYYQLEPKHRGKIQLLPHVAADTEHVSRVEGAKQAVDQMLAAIKYRKVVNLKGELPEGYINGGACTVAGVGKVSAEQVAAAVDQETLADDMRNIAQEIAAFWGAVAAVKDQEHRQELIERYGRDLILKSNRYTFTLESLGLNGPYSD